MLAGISVLLALGLTVGCVATAQFLKRDYIAQTQLSFEDSTVKVTIKEWEFLQGSGAEVYQTLKNGSEVHLGSLTYGDTIHPFKNGYFHATVENGKLQLTYTSKYNDTTGEPIRKTVSLELQPYDRFALPSWFVPSAVGFAIGGAVYGRPADRLCGEKAQKATAAPTGQNRIRNINSNLPRQIQPYQKVGCITHETKEIAQSSAYNRIDSCGSDVFFHRFLCYHNTGSALSYMDVYKIRLARRISPI